MNNEKKQKLILLLKMGFSFLLWLLLSAVMIIIIYKIQDIYPVISLRYNEAIQSSTAFSARKFSAQSKNEAACWPTYWSQTKELLHANYSQQESTCLWYSGNASLIYPFSFISGALPGELSENKLCVSNSLAWFLWGSEDVCGLTLNIGEEKYIVAGVFEDNEILAVISCGNTTAPQGWQGVQLSGSLPAERIEFAKNYALASGLGTADSVLDGSFIVKIFTGIAVLPSFLLLVFILACLFKSVQRTQNTRHSVLLFLTALLFAVLLPALLELLPETIIPGKWSDFGFWGELMQQKLVEAKQWLLIRPFIMDYKAKILLLLQMFSGLAAIINVILIGLRLLHKQTDISSCHSPYKLIDKNTGQLHLQSIKE